MGPVCLCVCLRMWVWVISVGCVPGVLWRGPLMTRAVRTKMVVLMLVNRRMMMAAASEHLHQVNVCSRRCRWARGAHLAETGAACRMVGKCSCQTEQRLQEKEIWCGRRG